MILKNNLYSINQAYYLNNNFLNNCYISKFKYFIDEIILYNIKCDKIFNVEFTQLSVAKQYFVLCLFIFELQYYHHLLQLQLLSLLPPLPHLHFHYYFHYCFLLYFHFHIFVQFQ